VTPLLSERSHLEQAWDQFGRALMDGIGLGFQTQLDLEPVRYGVPSVGLPPTAWASFARQGQQSFALGPMRSRINGDIGVPARTSRFSAASGTQGGTPWTASVGNVPSNAWCRCCRDQR
jgi:hypothetical protein